MLRPEQIAPPEIFYNEDESHKYTHLTRVQHIQAKMTLRALDLLNIGEYPHFVLDIGCGSGLSGEILTQEGHVWTGMDISPSMLAAGLDREVDGDLFLADMGCGVPFRAGSFDAVILISAIQWLCNADTSHADPKKRLARFFNTAFALLKRGGKFCAQFYPGSEAQLESILQAAKVAGFAGGCVVDNPESKKNKKYYLLLTAGTATEGLNLQGVTVDSTAKTRTKSKKALRAAETRKDYVNRKKEVMRKRGRKVAHDSVYTARQRRPKF